jgi:hypothetical protein
LNGQNEALNARERISYIRHRQKTAGHPVLLCTPAGGDFGLDIAVYHLGNELRWTFEDYKKG